MVGETPSLEDARRITDLVRDYFGRQEPTFAFLHFRIESINRNDDPKVWKVRCSFDSRFGSQTRITYTLKVNSETSEFSNIEQLEKPLEK
jgi:hypothetical protein